MTFNVPKPKSTEVIEWAISIVEKLGFIDGVPLYQADYYINEDTSIPAIALQRGRLREETNDDEICHNETALSSSLAITLHIEPTDKDIVDPVLYHFEEEIIRIFSSKEARDSMPNHLNYFRYSMSVVTPLLKTEDDSLFSNMSKVIFKFGFSV